METQRLKKSRLEKYLDIVRDGKMTEEEVTEYIKEQRPRIEEQKWYFRLALKHYKTEPFNIFQIVKIEYVASAREFYAIQICDLEARSEFQNVLNQAYDDDCEPINQLREKDVCIVYYDFSWCRAKVLDILKKDGKCRVTVNLVDYGRTIQTKEKYIGILKRPHEAIIPFVNKCQLSLLHHDDDDVSSEAITKEFERVSKNQNQIAIYFHGMYPDRDIHDVTLLTECEANDNTVDGAYLLHEAYSAFIRSAIQFDDELCEKWAQNIFQMCDDSMTNDTKKIQVFISYIVSPAEIYVKCKRAEAFMGKIRQIIDQYIRKNPNHDREDWSVGDDCLVRVQSWMTETTLKPWYRGRIIGEYPDKSNFRVFLRDYGRTFEVTSFDLRQISPQLAAPSNAVQRCRLSISKIWTELATNIMRQIVEEYSHFAISRTTKNENCLSVTFWATNSLPEMEKIDIWDDIGLRVISESVIESMQPFVKRTQRRFIRKKFRSNRNRCSDDDASITQSLEQQLSLSFDERPNSPCSDTNDAGVEVCKWLPAIPIDRHRVIGFVTHITNKGTIYMQEESNHEVVFQMEHQITKRVKKMNPEDFKEHAWRKGEPCFAWKKCASYENGVFSRAIIEKIDAECGTCLVYYIDHGKHNWFKLDDLYPATKFGDIPILVHRFHDSKFVAADKSGKWSNVVWKEFRDSLINDEDEIPCIVCVDRMINLNRIRNEILPCSIEARILPTDQYTMFKKNRLFYKVGYNANDEGILFV